MTPTTVCNLALAEIGQRIQIAALTDASPAANVAALFYEPKTQMLLRSANWDFARAQIPLSLWKSQIVNGALSNTPPPQPWQYSYLYPQDCLRMRFVQPTVTNTGGNVALTASQMTQLVFPPIPTSIPFVEGTDFDVNNNPIRVILTNVMQAQGVYTRDLSQTPDLWDPLFLAGETALLGSYFINALARDKAQMEQQVALAKSIIDQARVANGNEGISNVDHVPDWIRTRRVTGLPWLYNAQPNVGYGGGGYCSFPDGSFY